MRSQLGLLLAPRTRAEMTTKCDLFAKVISYMTQGVDVSLLFSTMIMAASAPTSPALMKDLSTGDESLDAVTAYLQAYNAILKKMLYLYISTYARQHADLALMTVNTLQKDCQHEDATIRGLALRALCGLKVPNLMEYLVPAVAKGLQDRAAYVRRTAVLGVLKAIKLHEATAANPATAQLAAAQGHPHHLVESVKTLLLRDTDPQCVSNACAVLSSLEGAGSLVTKALVYGLINRIKDFNEWNQCQVLHFVSLYEPQGKEETFDIMNALEDRLSHSNSAVVLATAKVFLHLTLPLPDVHQQVFERVKGPLITLVGSQVSPECAFAVLTHLRLLVSRAPMLFASDYRSFFVRASDPSFIKEQKLEILAMLAHVADMSLDGAPTGSVGRHLMEIVNELLEYVTDTVDVYLSRLAIRCIGKILLADEAESGSEDMGMLVERLMLLLSDDLGHNSGGSDGVEPIVGTHVSSECIVVLRDVLRKSPTLFATHCRDVVASSMPDDMRLLPSAQARAAYAWMLGEFADELPNAPYVLEDYVVSEDDDDEGEASSSPMASEESAAVKLEVLTALAKMFVLRPGEATRALNAGLTLGVADENLDVRGRAVHLLRLLEDGLSPTGAGMDAIGRVVWGGRQPGERSGVRVRVSDDTSGSKLDRIFREFNSLSVVYRKPASSFVSTAMIDEGLGIAAGGATSEAAAQPKGAAEEADLLSMEDTNLLVLEEPSSTPDVATAAGDTSGVASGIDLLSL